MSSQILLMLLVLVAFVASILTTRMLLYLAPTLGLTSAPNHRDFHNITMPKGGGLGFVVVISMATIPLYYSGYGGASHMLAFAGCGAIIGAIGLWDDITNLAIRWRLLVQLFCISLSTWLLGGSMIREIGASSPMLAAALFFLAVFLMTWWLNLFNFMDGIDGLASTEVIFITLGASVILWFGQYLGAISTGSPEIGFLIALLLLLASSVSGFLMFNWPPATIFMGDVGSTFLGFTLGMLALISIINDSISIWIWLILGGVFWVDSTVTLLVRMFTGQCWYQAHRSHAYQHAVILATNLGERQTYSIFRKILAKMQTNPHKTVTVIVTFINIFWLLPMAGLALTVPEWEIQILTVSWIPLLWVCFQLGAGKINFQDSVIPS